MTRLCRGFVTSARSLQMSYRLNQNLIVTSSPPIPLAVEWGSRYRPSSGRELISLHQGVPGTPPPQEYLDRMVIAAADPALTKYGDLRGELGLRTALAKEVNHVYGGDIQVDDVVITAGCNMAFYATATSLAHAGEEIILPVPYYFNHEMTLTQLGIVPRFLTCVAPAFIPSIEECRRLINSKTRAIVLVTPNNPTGAILAPALIQEFVDLAREHQIALILDETYRGFLPAEISRAHNVFMTSNWRDSVIHLFSFSKSYAIPGLRVGAVIASPILLQELSKTLDCIQINPPRPVQSVLSWSIEGTYDWREGKRQELNDRREMFQEIMKVVPKWEIASCGGYFAYVKHPFRGVRSAEVSKKLAEHIGVVVLPGSFFSPSLAVEDDCYLRFSIADVSNEILSLVPDRLKRLEESWERLK